MSTTDTIVPPGQMLLNIGDMAAAGVGVNDSTITDSLLQDIADECAKYHAMLIEGSGTDIARPRLDDIREQDAEKRIEALLSMVAETHTRTGAVLSILERAGLLDDVAQGVAAAPKLVKRAVIAVKAARGKAKPSGAQRVMSRSKKAPRKGSKAR